MTISDIAYTVAVSENSFEVWDRSRLDTAPKVCEETQQEEDLPEDRFCVLGEIEDCPWKVNSEQMKGG